MEEPKPRHRQHEVRRRDREARRRHRDYDERWQIASALIDGPRTDEELLAYFQSMVRRFGIARDAPSERVNERARKKVQAFLANSVDRMEDDGWVTRESDRIALTDLGREKADLFLADVQRGGAVIARLTRPQTVSAVTMGVHFLLALVKLPVAVISGSVGLLNDAIDTLVDGISSLLVFIGVRRGRERVVSAILIALMGVTGIITALEAVGRLIAGSIPSAEPVVFAAVLFSGLLCVGLFYYQRYVGLTSKCVPLIAQSVDSRNHVLVAIGVTIDLVAARLGVPYVDGAIGLVISVLIFKGAIELLLELVRSRNAEEADLSSFGFAANRHRARTLANWLLLRIDDGEISSNDDLEREARSSLDFSHIATYEALGIAEPHDRDRTVADALKHIRDGLAEGEPLRLTSRGRAELDRAMSRRLFSSGRRPLQLLSGVARHLFSFAFLLSVQALLAIGFRWICCLLPAAPLVRGGTPLVTIMGCSFSAADLWLAAAGAGLFGLGRIWTMLRRREEPFRGGRRLTPGVSRVASTVSLALLINSWWASMMVGLSLVGQLVGRFGGQLVGRRQSTVR